jgi:hypothetical protein
VLPLMFSEVGLKEPPPPAIDMLAVLVGTQAGVGDGLGLGDGLVPGDGLGLGDGLVPGDGLGLGEGLGLGLCASATLAPTLRKITPRATTARWTQCDCFRCRVRGARLDWVA